jgi:pimeloyl-ACP methyl ester carboxylesterase
VPVLAFHDGCEGKFRFMQKEPIPGVRLVSIDRPGYGGSSHAPANYTFENAVQDIVKLTEYLHIHEFVVLGHGVGGAWAQQLAAALPHRVCGAILWSSLADMMDSNAPGDLKRAMGYCDAVHYCNTGHIGRSPRHFMRGTSTAVAKDDFGALGLNQEKEEGGASFEKFAADSFWVSAMVDSWRPNRDRKSIRDDVSRTLCSKWQYNTEDIKCPVFVFHGDGDRDARCPAVPNFLKTVIPHAKVEILTDCGHICSFGPDAETRARIQRAVKAMPPRNTGSIPVAESSGCSAAELRHKWLLQPRGH